MNKIKTMVEIANPTKYNDAQVPGAPDSLVDPALAIMRATFEWDAIEYRVEDFIERLMGWHQA